MKTFTVIAFILTICIFGLTACQKEISAPRTLGIDSTRFVSTAKDTIKTKPGQDTLGQASHPHDSSSTSNPVPPQDTAQSHLPGDTATTQTGTTSQPPVNPTVNDSAFHPQLPADTAGRK
ncbi:MAG TPA: hypothetical protein VL307_09300 [Chitinophagaceae bacterium]|nr:hypothetical protein [Chitinophagaceae bacterium]